MGASKPVAALLEETVTITLPVSYLKGLIVLFATTLAVVSLLFGIVLTANTAEKSKSVGPRDLITIESMMGKDYKVIKLEAPIKSPASEVQGLSTAARDLLEEKQTPKISFAPRGGHIAKLFVVSI